MEQRDVPAFLTPTSYTAAPNPAAVTTGDFNGDGHTDIAVINGTAIGAVSVLLGNGNGTFQPKVDYSAESNGFDIKAGDFNGDGKVDLAVAGFAGVDVLLGRGDGTFGTGVIYTSGAGSHTLAIADFNNDGILDIATMNSGSASILLGNGDGTFRAHQDVAIPGNSTNTIAVDLNHDGNMDLVTSNTASIGTITILMGHGDGTFDPAENVFAGSAPVSVAVADYNHDGNDDFVVANSYAGTSMSIIYYNGNGTYSEPETYEIGETGYEIEAGDFNDDGNEDYAVRGAGNYMIGYGKGDGTFYPEVSFSTPTGQFEAGGTGDFNGDGALDFVYPSGPGVTVVMNANDDQAALAGAVGFKVTAPSTTTAGSVVPLTVTAVDAAGNPVAGFRGAVYINSSDPTLSPFEYTFTAADDGTHTFSGSIRLSTQGSQTITIAAPFMTAATDTIIVSPPVSQFGTSAPTAANAGDTIAITVRAIDSLGNVATAYTGTVYFTSSDVQAGLPADYTFTAADVGTHNFNVTLKSAGTDQIDVAEVGGAAVGQSLVDVAPGAATSFSLVGGSGAIGVDRPVSIFARDAFGNQATDYTGTVHFTSSDLMAVLPTDTMLVNGSATADVTLLTVGTQTITATDVANSTLTGTVSSDATPPVAALFAVSGYPSTTAGISNTFTVTVRDTIGQIATGYTGTIFFSSSDEQAGLPASYTFTAADAGVHTFSATFRTAGAQSMTVRDAAGLTGTQMGINVTPAAFSHFQVSTSLANPEGIQVTAGTAVPVTVRATDAFGNTVTAYTGTVSFSSTDTQAGLPASYTFKAADAGMQTFNVILKTSTANGVAWSIGVADVTNPATLATLTGFEVINGPAARFALSPPSNITAGTPFTLKVSIVDAFGNEVQNYFGTIHFANTAGIVGLPPDYTFNGADAGIHNFTVTLSTVGSQTLYATDVTNSLLTSSVTVNVKAPATGGGGGGGGGGATGGGGGGATGGGGSGGGGGKRG